MINRQPADKIDSRTQTTGRSRGRLSAPITIFAIPKPFEGHIGVIQRNAIASWVQLAPAVDVVLIGDESGIARAAEELGVHHISEMETNSLGTPLVSSAFHAARKASDSPVLCYCNCDVILLEDFVSAISRLDGAEELERFVAIGRRTEIELTDRIDFSKDDDVQTVREVVEQSGNPGALVCKEYFAFSRELYADMPDFAVGRGNWDNWMVASAKRIGVPVVNVSAVVRAIHQNHDYKHMAASRMDCYVSGTEAKENQRLAGGRNVVSGATATWKLDRDSLSRIRFAGFNPGFWKDLPRFGALLLNLVRSRR